MLKEIHLKNFKLFKEKTIIPFSKINLLTGINGRGKSTVIQSLLLMKQSIDYDRTTNKIIFNHDDVKLGSYADIKNVQTSSGDAIEIEFLYDDILVGYKLKEVSNEPMVAEIKEIKIHAGAVQAKIETLGGDRYRLKAGGSEAEYDIVLYDLYINELASNTLSASLKPLLQVKQKLNFIKLHYVSADRSGPQLYYHEKSLKDFYSVGSTGQDTVNVLYHSQDLLLEDEVIENLNKFFQINLEEIGRTISLQVEFWLNKIFDGVKIKVQKIDNAHLLTLSISSDGTFNYFKSTNVGYGYSYVLPIIIAGLISKPGEILVVENPEAHLHPFAQSIIAKFLVFISLKGVQIVVESHSEHILNGLRIPVFQKTIESFDLNVLYFDRNESSVFRRIPIEANGGIKEWPPAFFDQATKDLNYLFGI